MSACSCSFRCVKYVQYSVCPARSRPVSLNCMRIISTRGSLTHDSRHTHAHKRSCHVMAVHACARALRDAHESGAAGCEGDPPRAPCARAARGHGKQYKCVWARVNENRTCWMSATYFHRAAVPDAATCPARPAAVASPPQVSGTRQQLIPPHPWSESPPVQPTNPVFGSALHARCTRSSHPLRPWYLLTSSAGHRAR